MSHKLKVGWTIDAAQDLMALHGINAPIAYFFINTIFPFDTDGFEYVELSDRETCVEEIYGLSKLSEEPGVLVTTTEFYHGDNEIVFVVSLPNGEYVAATEVGYRRGWLGQTRLVTSLERNLQNDVMSAIIDFADGKQIDRGLLLANRMARDINNEIDRQIMNVFNNI